ncbi:MAG TPA: exodeoxyribonuclease VII large subunit [Streptosporangiaceae bacterium]
MPLQTTAESPVPVRTVLRLAGDWVGRLGRIWVEGQIAELTRRGGTAFLTLRDPVAAASVRVICPRTVLDAADPPPAEGARVVVWAKPDLNTARGSFSLTGIEIRAVGIGELLARLDRLRRSLAAEGLFAAERKRPLPFLPTTVGLICGRDSAAERDVRRNAAARWPAVRFRVEEVAVQGPYAVAEVTDALHRLDADRSVQVIVIARGGGSVEDLLPFSDESLIRAVAACQTPVVSAIGHEQDSPLLDFAADVRASTPTDAARRVVWDVAEQLALVGQHRARARRALAGRLDREWSWLMDIRSRPALADPLQEISRREEAVIALAERARRCFATGLERASDEVGHIRGRLLALSPAATLRRGYAIVQSLGGRVVRRATDVTAGERLMVRFAEDQLRVTAERAASTTKDE